MQTTAERETAEADAPKLPPSIPIAGRDCPLGALTFAEINELRAQARALRPNPLPEVKAHIEGLDVDLAKALLRDAVDAINRPVMFGTPEFYSALQSREGMRTLLCLSVRRGGGLDVPREAIDEAADALSIGQAGDLLSAAFML